MPVKVMTHLVAFYPSEKDSYNVAVSLKEAGADIIEVQFPFSDPTADGKYIDRACSKAINMGFSVQRGFNLIQEIKTAVEVPVFLMSYANLPFVYGLENFVKKAKERGIDGLIIPDLPFDNDEGLYKLGLKYNIHIIPVITPSIKRSRLEELISLKPKYIYTTLRKGITGQHTLITDKTIEFLDNLKKSGLLVLGGFGINSYSQIQSLEGHVYGVVIGSALIKSIEESKNSPPHEAVKNRLRQILGKG